MGGGFSRIAISRYDARAKGLFTIATPHDGSFGADIERATATAAAGLTVAETVGGHGYSATIPVLG
jgi:hypothetical protein